MKKFFVIAIALALVVSLFSGCSGWGTMDGGGVASSEASPSASNPSSESPDPAADVTPSVVGDESDSASEAIPVTEKTYEYIPGGIAPIDPESMGNNWGNGAEIQNSEGWTRYWKAYGNSTTPFDESITNLLGINRTTSGNPTLSPNTAWVHLMRIWSEKRADEHDVMLAKPFLFQIRPQEIANSFRFDFMLDPVNGLWNLSNGVYERGSKPFEHLPSADGSIQRSTIAANPYEIGLTKKYQYNKDAFHAIFISHDGRVNREYKVTWYDENGQVVDVQTFTGVLLDPTGSPTTFYTNDGTGQIVYDETEWTSEKPYGTEERSIENRAIVIPRGYKGYFTIETPELEPGESCVIWDGVAILRPENAARVRESIEPTSANHNGGAILLGF